MPRTLLASRPSSPPAIAPPLPEPSASEIEHWRAEIDHVDRVLVRLLNLRARLALKVAGLKRSAGLPLHAPARERDVLRNVTEANCGPLGLSAVVRLFRLIIRESRRLEEGSLGGARENAEGPPEAGPRRATSVRAVKTS